MEAWIADLAEMPVGWQVFLLSMLPVTELRGAIVLGIAWGMPPLEVFLWAVAGNFVPVVPLLLVLGWGYRHLMRHPFFSRPLRWLAGYGARNEEKVRRYGWLGLMLLVAVPLPGTGVWTGCLVATLLALPFWPSLAAITLGEIIAGILVSLVASSVLALSSLRYGEYVIIAILAVLFFFWLFRGRHRK